MRGVDLALALQPGGELERVTVVPVATGGAQRASYRLPAARQAVR